MRIVVNALIAFVVFTFFSACSIATVITTESVEEFPVEPGTNLIVSNGNGNIFINTWENDRIEIKTIKSSWGGSDEFEKVEVLISPEKCFTIETRYLENNSRVSVDFEIQLPSTVSVDSVNSSNGDIVLIGTSGDADLHSSNGDITATGVNGTINVRTSNGDITAFGITGIRNLRTSNGSITVEMLTINNDISISSSNGNIEIHVSEDINATVILDTSNGHIKLHDLEITSGDFDSDHIEGDFGNGGYEIIVDTSNGSIDIFELTEASCVPTISSD